KDRVGDVELAACDAALELRAGETDLVGAFERAHVLRAGRGNRRYRVHLPNSPRRRPGTDPAATSVLVVLFGCRALDGRMRTIRTAARMLTILFPSSPTARVRRLDDHAAR